MIDSEINDVIANILKMNEPLVVPVPVRGLIVFDTNGIEEVDSGFRITHFCTTQPSLPSFLRSRDPPPHSCFPGLYALVVKHMHTT